MRPGLDACACGSPGENLLLRLRIPELLLAIALSLGLPSVEAAGPAAKNADIRSATLKLQSSAALVLDQISGRVLYGKNTHAIVPIASITKLMTAMVVLDADLEPEEPIAIADDDVDYLRGTHSRLKVGTVLARDDLLRLALMASENRAAAALSRAYPGGREAFVQAMNLKAQSIGMSGSRFVDPTGLSSTNVSTAEDLSLLVRAAHRYEKIREYTTTAGYEVEAGGRRLAFRNTNGLVYSNSWDIGVSKTGFINEAGRCLVMQATLAGREVVIVLLDSWGKYSRQGDAQRIRKWLEVAAGVGSPPRSTVSGKSRLHLSSLESRSEPGV
jgi:D-alanyl-D-alanine endopeptidase (penicillin-binding protein 7)